jgi:ankyrin repeat protein
MCARMPEDISEFLSDPEADVDMTVHYGHTPLMYSANRGSMDDAALLLDRGADINKTDDRGVTALMHAVARMHDVNDSPTVRAHGNYREVVALLLDRGADLNIVDQNGQTALNFAMDDNHSELVELLVAMGANMTKESHKVCEKEKKSQRNFNYKIGMDDEWDIDRFIGIDDNIINEFKHKIEEELNVENVSVKILKWNDEMLEMYRLINTGMHFGSWEKYFIFKVSFLGGEKSDILKVEKMIVDFVYINTLDNDDA